MDIYIDMYPELKEELCDIFSNKVSLVDLARRLERDFLVYETERKKFKLAWKKEVIPDF